MSQLLQATRRRASAHSSFTASTAMTGENATFAGHAAGRAAPLARTAR